MKFQQKMISKLNMQSKKYMSLLILQMKGIDECLQEERVGGIDNHQMIVGSVKDLNGMNLMIAMLNTAQVMR